MPNPQGYATGHVRAANKDHLIELSSRKHRGVQTAFAQATPPPSWDSRALGWCPPIKDQGNCHDDRTEVLTEKGWVAWPDYDWRTALGTMHPLTGALQFQPCLERHVYDYDGPMYYSGNQCLDFALTPSHRLFACDADRALGRRGGQKAALSDFDYVPVEDVGWRVALPHATSGWLGTELNSVGVGRRDYTGDDFLALVALVISDGHVGHDHNGEGSQNRITFCCFRDDRQEMVRGLAQRLGIKEESGRPGVWYFTDATLAEWFRQNAYRAGGFTATYKHVPALVKCASQRQIEHFLRFFGDQSIRAVSGARTFFSSSELMADDVQELLLRVGKRASISKTPPRESAMTGGRVIRSKESFTLHERQGGLLSLDRKAHLGTDHYKGKVFCATVPNGTLVTRRNKSVLISGNCGSCWDFSGTGVVEIAYWKVGIQVDLSEQYTLSCGRNGGCSGDDNVTVLEWAKKTGIPTTQDYGPYHASARSSCAFKQSMTLHKLDDWGFVSGDSQQRVTDTELIKAAIQQYGCVGCAVDAGFNDPGTGVISGHGNNIDHDVILVGWDDSKGSKGAWIMRNSWATRWGDQGYAWIEYGSFSIGTEAVWGVVQGSSSIDYFV